MTEPDVLDKILLEHKNALVDHLHEAYHNPNLRTNSKQFYIDLHRKTVAALNCELLKARKKAVDDLFWAAPDELKGDKQFHKLIRKTKSELQQQIRGKS